eukprot:132024_1
MMETLQVLLCLSCIWCIALSQTPNQTHCIMTRDNICLRTDVYFPTKGDKPWSTVYIATPYGKNTLSSRVNEWRNVGGFVVLGQDFRGRHKSNGTWEFWRTAGNDTLDTVKWMLNRSWSDGYMNVQGKSANSFHAYGAVPGVTQAIWNGEGEAGYHKYDELLNHITAGMLELGNGLGYDTVFQDGAYRECLIEVWLSSIADPSLIASVRHHEAFSQYWYPLSGNWTQWDSTHHPNTPQWAIANFSIMHHAGWYDIFGSNQIETAIGINNTGYVGAKGQQILIIEPGGHCEGGEILWPNDTFGNTQMHHYANKIFPAAIAAKKANKLFDVHEYIPWNVLFYMLGPGTLSVTSNGNFWVFGESLPPFTSKPYYLSTNEGISNIKPVTESSKTYTYDPKHPVWTYGGNNLACQPCGPWDQSTNENSRHDILHFTSSPLIDDLYIVGKIIVTLYVQSDCVDTDFTAKLIDIYPDDNGKVHMLVQDGIQRMRWRDGHYHTSPATHMKPKDVYEININVGYMSYIFNKGHKISLSVSSSNHERFSVNFNNGLMVDAGDKNWKIAHNTIHFGGKYPSQIILPVVDKHWIEQRRHL